MILSMRSIWLGDCADRGTRRLGDGEVGEIFYELFSIILLNFKNLYDLYGLILATYKHSFCTELHRVFLEMDCVERDAQSRFT